MRYFASYTAVLATLLAVDLLWIDVIAKSYYLDGIGHLMAAKPNLAAALAFYLIFAGALMFFAIVPHGPASEWAPTIVRGALLGFVAYATYDLSNLAILRDWPLGLTVVDIMWGTALSTLSVVAGRAAWRAATKASRASSSRVA